MSLQPFLSYQATKTLTLTLQSETTANWEVDGRWTVPVNVVVSKLSSFGTFPASYQFGVGGFAVHPDTGPSWKVRGAIVILLPRHQERRSNQLSLPQTKPAFSACPTARWQ